MIIIPMVLSFSRIPLGFAVATTASLHIWWLALMLLVIGALTDLFDGIAARHFNVGTAVGRDYIEPICDLFLTLGALFGLVLGGVWPAWVAWGIIGGFVILEATNQLLPNTAIVWLKKAKHIERILMPTLYLALLLTTGMFYVGVTFSYIGAFIILVYVPLVSAATSVAMWRWDRLKGFLTGNY